MSDDPAAMFEPPRQFGKAPHRTDIERDGWLISPDHAMLEVLKDAITGDARSVQEHVGPSELGSPCTRYLALRSLHAPRRITRAPWATRVGIGVHQLLADIMPPAGADNGVVIMTEVPVHIQGSGVDRIAGTLDAAVLTVPNAGEVAAGTSVRQLPAGVTAEIIDWKVVGEGTMSKVHKGTLSRDYRTQILTYALGFQRTYGIQVTDVSLIFLPSYSRLEDATAARFRIDADDMAPVHAALERYNRIANAVVPFGIEGASRRTATANSRCHECGFNGVPRPSGDGVLCRGNKIEKEEGNG